jgi:hypothetical protein
LREITGHRDTMPFPWDSAIPLTAIAIVAGVVVELKRPFVIKAHHEAAEDISDFEKQLHERIAHSEQYIYSQSQSPIWMSAMAVLAAVGTLAGVVLTWREDPLVSYLLFIAFVLYITFCGGIRVTLTNTELIVRLGYLGIKLLDEKFGDISVVEVIEFSPLRDFGGYGIRFNKQMRAFFFSGNRGVKITARAKNFLIGSDHPDKLAAAIRAAQGS